MALVEREKNEANMTVVDKERGIKATARFDGCIHLDTSNIVDWDDEDEESVFNDPNNTGYLHICNIDNMIRFLTELKKHAESHFGPNWPD